MGAQLDFGDSSLVFRMRESVKKPVHKKLLYQQGAGYFMHHTEQADQTGTNTAKYAPALEDLEVQASKSMMQ